MAKTATKTNKKVIAIFLVVLIDVLGITIMLPLLPFYSEHFGASANVVGLLVSVYAFCQLISGPILGNLSDRYGRRPILIISQIGTFIGFLILGFAQSLAWIFVSRIIDGLTAGNLSTAQSYITDVTTAEERPKALAKISIAFGIGFFIGPALTSLLLHRGLSTPIFAASGLSFLSIMATTFFLPSEKSESGEAPKESVKPAQVKKPRPPVWSYFSNRVLLLLFIELFLFYFAFSTYMSGFALFAERRFTIHGQPLTAKQVGYAFTYFGFLGILIQGFLIGRLVDRFGERKLALMGFVTSAIGYASLGLISGPAMIALTGLFTSFGGGVLRPVLVSDLAGQAEPRERGRMIGINQSLMSIAQILAPLAATALIGAGLLGSWAVMAGAVSAIGGAFAFYLITRGSDKKTAQPSMAAP